MSLEVELQHTFGAFALDVAFQAPPGVTALFGPSGSGKSSIVAMLAGLVRPARGRIVLDGRTLLDTTRRVRVPTHRRRFGVVFQDGRLFPHMTVRRNLNYARAAATDEPGIVHLLGIEHLLDRRPAKLSGGEKQRVAIGRALMSDPAMLLMDEPLASLDASRRAEIMPWLERLRDESGIPILYVSHARDEIERLATTVFRIEGGRIVGRGLAPDRLAHLDATLKPGDPVRVETVDGGVRIVRAEG